MSEYHTLGLGGWLEFPVAVQLPHERYTSLDNTEIVNLILESGLKFPMAVHTVFMVANGHPNPKFSDKETN